MGQTLGKYRYVYSFFDGLAEFYLEKNGVEKFGFIDKGGRGVILPKYDAVSGFNKGVSAVKLNGKWGLINQNGEQISPLIYDSINMMTGLFNNVNLFNEDLIAVSVNKKYGFINKFGKEIVFPQI